MAIVGNKSVFAIEWESSGANHDNNEYVNFCFWVNNERLGDYTDEVSLPLTIYYLREFLENAHSRTVNHLCGSPKEDVFSQLYESIMLTATPGERLHELVDFGEMASTTETLSSQLRERFHLDDVGGASFTDKYNIILFNDSAENSQRMIYRTLSDMNLHEATLPQNCFDDVANTFLSEVEKKGFQQTENI